MGYTVIISDKMRPKMDRALLTEVVQEQYRELLQPPVGTERERLKDVLDILKKYPSEDGVRSWGIPTTLISI